ncbi:MAG: ABC transporter permease [Gemmiger sp.]|uniref:ABC transporter permease n=1 Tax=Gemmiger sp. TaxID=2049027 RepID=UPI002E784B7B|nr:ABC transporter permease [Gemmiger sp.]MEE0800962.1 ABC transporter permease [Gemmiger sp.]
MANNKKSLGLSLRQKSSSVLAALLCIVIGMLIGLVVLFIINTEHAWQDGFLRIMQGGFYDFPYGVGKTLTQAAPLIMTGLSVAFAFKTGLFNIGAAGQYTLGAFGALYCALVLQLPWWACLLASALFGAIWGAIPGIFKAYLNINEVITSIMFNWIGLYLVNEIIYGRGSGIMYDAHNTRTWKLANNAPQALIPSGGMSELFHTSNNTIAIFLAILMAVLVWVILEKTTFGYELKAVGLNKDAARYAGINEKKNIILSMTIAGALAGFGAGLFYLSGGGEWNPLNSTSLPAMGFNGIATALLASSHPIGTIFSSLFISHITVGGAYLPTRYFPTEIADLISGIIIYLCAFSMLFRGVIQKKLLRKHDTADANAEPAKDNASKEGK